MTTALYTHPVCLLHDNGPGHPESPERLKAVVAALEAPEFANLLRREAPLATLEQIARVHERTYIDHILSLVPQKGRVPLDDETCLTPHSGEAALRAAGALCAAVDDVMGGQSTNAFCAVRPPGHHAAVLPMSGFCLFNNIAIGTTHALATYDIKRIAIVDFDVHHGNATEAWAVARPEILFFSSHQFPLWPGSGRAADKGPLGNIVNLPLPPGADGAAFRHAMQSGVLPKIDAFEPEMIFISAGFDAHRDDPLAGLQFGEEDFGWITEALVKQAARLCRGRIVSTLEGGYNLQALARCAAAHVKALQAA